MTISDNVCCFRRANDIARHSTHRCPDWTCMSWAEAVPLPWTSEAHHGQVRCTMDKWGDTMDKWGAPWTSMTTSASSGRDPTGWSSSASTSSPDRWPSWYSSLGRVSHYLGVKIKSNTQWLFHNHNVLLQAFLESPMFISWNLSCQHVMQIMKKSNIQVLALDYAIHSPPSLPSKDRECT